MRSTFVRALPLLLLASLGGCNDPVRSPGLVDESELTFVRVSPDAPPLIATDVSFYAKKGEARQVELRYESYANGNGKCLLLHVPADALLQDAQGRVYAPGDSVLIRVRLMDEGRFLFAMEPDGIRFDPAHPIQLEVRYSWADEDMNGDGVVDARDDALRERFGFWRQGRPGAGWGRVATTRDSQLLEARANLTSFSQYALASD